MSRKRPTADQIGSLLSEPHFRRDDTTSNDASNQAVTPTPMLLDVNKIVPYDRNPRRTVNDTYEQIKESIRATGLDQVLVVTQRPDAADSGVYMIGAGGNTRLTALQELWQETADERFKQVWCQFRPWEDDTHTLLAHIRENDLRSDLTFIDRALAIAELREMLQAESGKSLSLREFSDQLNDRGYRIGRTMIGFYGYVVEALYPLIPTALQSGLGRHRIEQIRSFQRAFDRVWSSLAIGSTEESGELFAQILQRHDSDVLDFVALRRDLEEELSIAGDCDLSNASLEFGAALGGAREAAPVPGAGIDDTQSGSAGSDPANVDRTSTDASESPALPATSTGSSDDKPSAPASSQTKPTRPTASAPTQRPDKASATDAPSAQTTAALPSETPARPDPPTDIKSLRSRCWTLASRLAQGARLGDIVVPIHTGIGYLVGPVPVDVQSGLHPDLARSAMCVWWQLATLSEQFARHGRACAVMPNDWQSRRIGDAMRHARDSDQAFAHWQWSQADRDLFSDVPGLEPNDLGPWLYQTWTDQRWTDWIALVDTYRALYRQSDNAPWEKA